MLVKFKGTLPIDEHTIITKEALYGLIGQEFKGGMIKKAYFVDNVPWIEGIMEMDVNNV